MRPPSRQWFRLLSGISRTAPAREIGDAGRYPQRLVSPNYFDRIRSAQFLIWFHPN
jgi:hypothetical protein